MSPRTATSVLGFGSKRPKTRDSTGEARVTLALAPKLQALANMESLAPLLAPSTKAPHATPAMRHSRRTQLLERASLFVPLAGVGIGAWCALCGEGATRKLGVTLLGGSLGVGLARWQLARWFSEKARYEIESFEGDFEVRRYAPRVQAETVLNAAPWQHSLKEGFERLARYISGANSRRRKLAMTAPVLVTVGARDRSTRTVAFKMPDCEPFEGLPAPDDRQITLRRIPARRVAALSYRGRYGRDMPAQKRQELLTRIRAAGLLPIGEVTFAGYDAPWTLPWLRRNEVQIELSSMPGVSTLPGHPDSDQLSGR